MPGQDIVDEDKVGDAEEESEVKRGECD